MRYDFKSNVNTRKEHNILISEPDKPRKLNSEHIRYIVDDQTIKE